MNYDNNVVKQYLSHLDKMDLLTREQENRLLKSIEKHQKEFIRSACKYKLFLAELRDILTDQPLSQSNVMKLSKSLTDKSIQSDIDSTMDLFKLIQTKLNNLDDSVAKDLENFNISGNILHTLFRKFKKHKKSYDNSQESHPAYVQRYSYDVELLYKLITRCETKMNPYINELVNGNLRLVVSRAKRFINKGLDFEDLIQEGNLGLIRAINKHDASRGVKVATHATWWIDQAIRRAISNKGKTVRIPTHIEFLQSNLKNAARELTNELGRAPTKQEIADRADVDVKAIKNLEKTALHEVGLEDELSSGVSLIDIIPCESSKNPMNEASQNLLREKVRQVLSMLSPRNEKIIRLRFGIGEPRGMTLQEIGNQMGITKQGIRVIEKKALEDIKKKGKLTDEF